MSYKENRKKAFLERIKDYPWYKKYWEKLKYWVNHSEGLMVFFICLFIWVVGLIPSGIFALLWWLLDPTGFWQTLAMLVFLGIPLAPFIFGGIFIAIAISVVAISEGV